MLPFNPCTPACSASNHGNQFEIFYPPLLALLGLAIPWMVSFPGGLRSLVLKHFHLGFLKPTKKTNDPQINPKVMVYCLVGDGISLSCSFHKSGATLKKKTIFGHYTFQTWKKGPLVVRINWGKQIPPFGFLRFTDPMKMGIRNPVFYQ